MTDAALDRVGTALLEHAAVFEEPGDGRADVESRYVADWALGVEGQGVDDTGRTPIGT